MRIKTHKNDNFVNDIMKHNTIHLVKIKIANHRDRLKTKYNELRTYV